MTAPAADPSPLLIPQPQPCYSSSRHVGQVGRRQPACRLVVGTRGDRQSPRRIPSCPTWPLSRPTALMTAVSIEGDWEFYGVVSAAARSLRYLGGPTAPLRRVCNRRTRPSCLSSVPRRLSGNFPQVNDSSLQACRAGWQPTGDCQSPQAAPGAAPVPATTSLSAVSDLLDRGRRSAPELGGEHLYRGGA